MKFTSVHGHISHSRCVCVCNIRVQIPIFMTYYRCIYKYIWRRCHTPDWSNSYATQYWVIVNICDDILLWNKFWNRLILRNAAISVLPAIDCHDWREIFFFLLKQFMNTFDWFGTFVLLFISLRGWRIYIYIYIVYQTWDKVYVMNIVLANLSACVRTPVFSFSFFNFLFSAVQRHEQNKRNVNTTMPSHRNRLIREYYCFATEAMSGGKHSTYLL